MKLKKTPELHSFLSTHFLESDPTEDEATTQKLMKEISSEQKGRLASQIRLIVADPDFPFDELGSEANRWFADAAQAHAWLSNILHVIEGAQSGEVVVVKDAHGTPLQEDDSVYVIKDLKVKGGSSDLKRGTLIKKIRLIDDHEAIECRVDGSTLVLKTCFLKKA